MREPRIHRGRGDFGTKTDPHFGHRIRSESIRTTSAGGIEYPQEGQVVVSASKTFFRSIFLCCIMLVMWHRGWRIQGEDSISSCVWEKSNALL